MPPVNPESRQKYPLGTKQWHGAEGLAEDARAYNELVTSWSAVESNASREPAHKQGELF